MIRVVQFAEFGPPEVLRTVRVPAPTPGAGQVRIAVEAAGVQPFDAALRRGDMQRMRPIELPGRLGNEVAGTVDAVGEGSSVRVGSEVIAFLDLEGYASHVVVPETQLVPKPAGMGWAEAGALSVSGQTASTALDALGVGPGDRVLVHAAAGGVGSLAVQIARILGARVIGTASERNHQFLRTLGAEPVTYGPGLAERVRDACPEGITVALDAIGGEAVAVSMELVGDPSRVVTLTDWRAAQEHGVRRIGTDRSVQRLAQLTRWHTEGRIRVPIAGEFPLEAAAEAHHIIETGHTVGKLVLRPGLRLPELG